MGTNILHTSSLEKLLSQSVAATTYTNYIQCDFFRCVFVQLNISSASVDCNLTVTLEVSIDGTNWATYSGTSIAVTAATVIPYDINITAARFVRAKITRTAGSATVECLAFAKQ